MGKADKVSSHEVITNDSRELRRQVTVGYHINVFISPVHPFYLSILFLF